MSGLASALSPHPVGATPNSYSAKGKTSSISKLQCPSAMSGQRQQAGSCQLGWGGVGARVKTVPPAKSPIGVGCWNLGEKEERKVNQESPPGFLWSRVGQDRYCLLVSS